MARRMQAGVGLVHLPRRACLQRRAALTAGLLGSLAAPWLMVISPPAAAQSPTVSISGRMGNKAVLVINGSPRSMAVGSAEQGVRLLSLADDTAVVEVDGQRLRLQIGAHPVNLGGTPTTGTGTTVVMPMGPGGHFSSAGSINDKPVMFMVDTGASVVAISQTEADRLGLDYRSAARGMVQTANGTVPVHSVRLAKLRIGDVQVYDVAAVVIPAPLPQVLLGNSFLSRFDMKRLNDTLTLEKRR